MLNVLIIVNWVVIGLIGLAMVYALAWAIYDSVADVKKSKVDKASNDLWQQMLLDDVYYRDSYAELFSGLLRDLQESMHSLWLDFESMATDEIENPFQQIEELDSLVNAVKQFVDDSKVMR